MGTKRQRRSLSARLRSEVNVPFDTKHGQDEHPCPTQVRPLLYFYKYLQPLPDGRKLQLHMPATLVCEKLGGQENVLSISTDIAGNVVKEDKGPHWRKRLLCDFLGVDPQSAASLLSVGIDEVIAVRNVAHWKKGSGGSNPSANASNSKSMVLTRRAFDHVVNSSTELAFSLQQYVRCRGSHASIFRVTWGEKDNRRFAINIFNEAKFTDAPGAAWSRPSKSGDDQQFHGTPLESAVAQMIELSPFYCVTATSGRDLYKHQQQLRIPKVRGAPVAEGVDAVKRIVDHFTSQLPGIRVGELTADFIKDNRGIWWFIRVVCFSASYRVEIPQSILNDPLLDSAVLIPDSLRSKSLRQSLRTICNKEPENSLLPNCTLCGAPCELPKQSRERDKAHHPQFDSSEGATLEEMQPVINDISEYRMTVNMIVSTLFQLRQRGQTLAVWEHAALLLAKAPTGPVSEFTVCYLCYKIYKTQVQLKRVAEELHETYGIERPRRMNDGEEEDHNRHGTKEDVLLLQTKILRFNEEQCLTFTVDDDGSQKREQPFETGYSFVRGVDVDPTSQQLRLVFFFHELQDSGPAILPSDFYLEYHLGQHFVRLDFEGSKCHTPNRWQLCEARLHYLLATMDGFSDYCTNKSLRIKLKSVQGGEYHGHTSMSLRPLLSAAKWYGASVQRETRVDYLLELKTDAFGLLTLKLTLGLLVDPVAFSEVRDLVKLDSYVREEPFAVFWPPPAYQSCSLAIPVDWIGALAPSEYVSVVPMRSRLDSGGRYRVGYVAPSRQPSHRDKRMAKSPSQRFSATTPAKHPPVVLQLAPKTPSASMPSLPSTVLSSVVVVVKRIVYRVAGEVPTFSSILLGHLLRSAAHLSRDRSQGNIASWTEPASYALGELHTMDTIFRDIQGLSAGAVCVVGELLLVLASGRMIPTMLDLGTMEHVLEPFWLLGHGASDSTKLLSFGMILPRECSAATHARAVWNRAIRRCHVSRLCPDVRGSDHNATRPQDKDAVGSSTRQLATKYNALIALRRKTSYRAKMQAYVMCCVFESMEAADSGYIDIAELRSLHKFVVATATPAATVGCEFETQPTLQELVRLRDERMFSAFVCCLMDSGVMQECLAEFDKLGQGGMSFDEFHALTDKVMEEATSRYGTQEEEPTCSVFCLRHGVTSAYALDLCCVRCATEYQDQQFLPRHRILRDASSSDSDQEVGNDDDDHDESDDGVDTKAQRLAVATQRTSDAHMGGTQRGGSDALEDPALIDTLEKLQAAEWHVRYRRGSLGPAALEAALSERKASVLSMRRSSTASSTISERTGRKGTNGTTSWITDLVAEAEERKQQTLGLTDVPAQRIVRAGRKLARVKKPKRKRLAQGSAQGNLARDPLGRLSASHSISSLLRTELEDATRRGRASQHVADRSSKLVDDVQRGESRRKKLDHLVLAELEDVKQRLARLLHTC